MVRGNFPVPDPFQQIIAIYIGLVVTCNVVSMTDKIRGTNRTVSKTQMGYGQPSGFFGIIGEISLHILIRVVTDDFNGGLIRAYRTV